MMVIFSHSYPLAQGNNRHEPFYCLTGGLCTGGGLAVEAFFIISGFLITCSWLRKEKLLPFIKNRVLRIYPGYLVALAVSIFLTTVCSLHPAHYCAVISWKRLLDDGILLSYGALDNLFAFPANAFPGIVNGSLWTIRYEFMCYLTVALLGAAGLLRNRAVTGAAFMAAFGLYCFKNLGHTDVIISYWHFLPIFLAGAVFYSLRGIIPKSRMLLFAALALLAAGLLKKPFLNLAVPLAGTYLLLWVCLLPPLRKLSFFQKNDLSYGTYLYAFPVMQCIQRFLHIGSPLLLFFVSLAGAILAALLSWFFIEKPCLQLKKMNVSRLFKLRNACQKKDAPVQEAAG